MLVKDNVEVGLRLEYALKILPENEVKNKQGFLRKAILENWRVKDIKSKNEMNISDASKIKNQIELNNKKIEKETMKERIDFINDAMKKTGIKAEDLQGEEKPIPPTVITLIKAEIDKEVLPAESEMLLNAFNFTVERFKQVYMKKKIPKSRLQALNRKLRALSA